MNRPTEKSNYPAPLKSQKLQARQAAQWAAYHAEAERVAAAEAKAVEAFLAAK